MLLPTEQVLWCVADGSTKDVELYTSPATVNTAWAPTVTSVPRSITRGATNSISGTQFNGFSAGTTYGDDAQMATNFPLVRITNLSTKHVFYARTSNFSTMGIATGSTVVSANFVVPTTAETGSSSLVVVANGIASTPNTAFQVIARGDDIAVHFVASAPIQAYSGRVPSAEFGNLL